MFQLVYVSSARPDTRIDTGDILDKSRRNNRRDGITGLLYADGVRFLQALEGERDKVEAAFLRIKDDPRHRAIVVLSSRETETREFGDWAMAHRVAGDDADAFVEQVAALVADASPDLRATFEGFAQVRRTA